MQVRGNTSRIYALGSTFILLAIVFSVLFTASDYSLGILELRLLITLLVS